MSIDYNLVCDVCGKVIDGSLKSASEVRKHAIKQGIAKRIKNKDVCFHCIEEKSNG